MRTVLIALVAAFIGCSSSSSSCSADAGDDLKGCFPETDGGSADCLASESCAPFGTTGGYRCMTFCPQGGHCTRPNTLCSAVAVGQCNFPDAGADAGGSVTCRTEFLCYPNRCR